MSILLFIVGILLFIGLVVVHEWGHFIVARRNGVVAEEFGIFFPPRLWSKRVKVKKDSGKHSSTKQDWTFSINALPLGGFVKLKGEHDSDTEPGSFGAASTWAKAKIMAAGVFMNLIVAIFLLMILAWLGMPKLVDNQFTVKSDTKIIKNEVLANYIEPGSPAAKAGLKPNDHIVSIEPVSSAPHKLKSADALRATTDRYAGEKVRLVYEHKGDRHQSVITLRTDKVVKASQNTNDPKGHLGVVPTEYTMQRSTWSAPIVAAGLTGQFTALTFQGLGHALAGLGGIISGAVTGNTTAREHAQTEASSQVAGPVGIFVILKDGTLLGFQFMLFIIAVISLTLAIMNILPIPALDGGRLWLMLVSRAVKRPLSPKNEELINAAGFTFLMALIILITIVDVRRFL